MNTLYKQVKMSAQVGSKGVQRAPQSEKERMQRIEMKGRSSIIREYAAVYDLYYEIKEDVLLRDLKRETEMRRYRYLSAFWSTFPEVFPLLLKLIVYTELKDEIRNRLIEEKDELFEDWRPSYNKKEKLWEVPSFKHNELLLFVANRCEEKAQDYIFEFQNNMKRLEAVEKKYPNKKKAAVGEFLIHLLNHERKRIVEQTMVLTFGDLRFFDEYEQKRQKNLGAFDLYVRFKDRLVKRKNNDAIEQILKTIQRDVLVFEDETVLAKWLDSKYVDFIDFMKQEIEHQLEEDESYSRGQLMHINYISDFFSFLLIMTNIE